jgi:predicted enzyme related to lactoylglutathione lyase
MIDAAHAIIDAEDADAARAFFPDVLGTANVDAHGGWLIFQLPPGELGIHPAADPAAPSGHHELYLLCDDIEKTVRDLGAAGVEFTEPITDRGFGLVTFLRVPGAGAMGLYQPKHLTAFDLAPHAGGS